MNKTLALLVDESALFGATEPLREKYFPFPANNPQGYPLIFDLSATPPRYGPFEASEGKGILADFWKHLAEGFQYEYKGYTCTCLDLFRYPWEHLIEAYKKEINRLEAGSRGSEGEDFGKETIPLKVVFSDSIPAAQRIQIQDFLQKENGIQAKDPVATSISALALHTLKPGPGKYAVLEALGKDLHLSLVQLTENAPPVRLHHEVLEGYGSDPRIYVIAEEAVNSANKQLYVLHEEKTQKAEVAAQLGAARHWRDGLVRQSRPFIRVKIALSPAPTNFVTVVIRRDEVEKQTNQHAQRLVRLILDIFSKWEAKPTESLTQWQLLGDNLQNTEFIHALEEKGILSPSAYSSEATRAACLQALLAAGSPAANQPPAAVPKPASQPSQPQPAALPQRRPVHTLQVGELSPGNQVEFAWAPNRRVIAAYRGNGHFQIVYHEHSRVVKGDSFQASSFTTGQPATLKTVVRQGGKVLGDYRSGTLTELYLVK